MRLSKLLRDAGVAARRKADQLIQDGHVEVNGRSVCEPWHEVDVLNDTITVDGRPVALPTHRHYLKLYKPRGVTSTLADPHAERTLLPYIPDGLRLTPVGRLDKDSEGLILLTDDGQLAYRLTHPRFGVPKRYRATLTRSPGKEVLALLRNGIQLDDGPFQPSGVRRTSDRDVELTLHEGRKREIRRGFIAAGLRVDRLVRLAIGPLELGDLRPGQVVPLTAEELRALGVHTIDRPA